MQEWEEDMEYKEAYQPVAAFKVDTNPQDWATESVGSKKLNVWSNDFDLLD